MPRGRAWRRALASTRETLLFCQLAPSGLLHSLLRFRAPAGISEFNPGRRVITGLFPTAHLPVDIRHDKTFRYGWAEEQMIDAKARVPGPRIPKIIPEGIDPFTRMKRPHRIGPALRK